MRIERADRGRIFLASIVTAVAVPVMVSEYQKQRGDEPGTLGVQGANAPLVVPAPTETRTRLEAAAVAPSAAPPAAQSPLPPTTAASGKVIGTVSYDDFDNGTWGERTCTAFSIPVNTKLELTNVDSGKRSWCVVREQRELPSGLVLTVDTDVFDELGDRAVGAATVEITWSR
jgi:hypothetical protein